MCVSVESQNKLYLAKRKVAEGFKKGTMFAFDSTKPRWNYRVISSRSPAPGSRPFANPESVELGTCPGLRSTRWEVRPTVHPIPDNQVGFMRRP